MADKKQDAPDTLPADFFHKAQPDTLPGNFSFPTGPGGRDTLPNVTNQQIKHAGVEALKWLPAVGATVAAIAQPELIPVVGWTSGRQRQRLRCGGHWRSGSGG